jgi:hypothetical protein
MHRLVHPLLAVLIAIAATRLGAVEVTATSRYTDDKLGMVILSGETRLPADANWTLAQPSPESGLHQVFYQISNWSELRSDGVRALAERIEQKSQTDRYALVQQLSVLRAYATTHGDRGPTSLSDPDLLELVGNGGSPRRPDQAKRPRNLQNEADSIERFRKATAEFGLVPTANLKLTQAGAGVPVLFELAPAIDDGKHWVLLTDGSSQRVPVDTALLKSLGLSLTKKNVIPNTPPPRPTEQILKLYARVDGEATGPAPLVFTDSYTQRTATVTWGWAGAKPGEREQLSTWTAYRAGEWTSLAAAGEAPLLRTWLDLAEPLYGASLYRHDRQRANARGGRTPPSLLALFGGRAAVEETLQLQLLTPGNAPQPMPEAPAVPLAQLRGVEVKSHPYAELVRGKTLPSLALAELVPPDRAFFYAARPTALTQLFAPGSPFVQRAGAFVAGGIGYDLLARYTAELGLSRPLTDALLDGGLLSECAVFTPDLFLADGTDVTVIVRVRSGKLLAKLLKPLLAKQAGSDGVYTVPTAAGAARWSIQGDLWVLSTHPEELNRTLALFAQKGTGSLGRSDEFRYMLSQLPPTADTQAYVYLSDPFIRRLVGPQVKIAQLRRVGARIAMERLVGASLLRQLDVGGAPASTETLRQLGYLAPADLSADLTLNADHTASSARFGPLARLKPLSAQADTLTEVTAAEAAAYNRYLENYTQFWRQFFDPIALRFGTAPDGRQTVSTFILPLVENSTYNALREWLPTTAPKTPGLVPVFDRDPVAQLDLVLPEKTWRAISFGQEHFLREAINISPDFFDLLGPSLHVAVEDGDPIIRIGTGELASLFNPIGTGGGNRMESTMLYLPVMLNLFTRPTHIAIALTDPERAARLLENAAPQLASGQSSWMRFEFYRQGPERVWILSLRPMGMASIDFSLRIDGGYLIISNHPFGAPLRVKSTRPAALAGAAISFHPKALATSLPADFASAMQAERARALVGMGHVYPWMQTLRMSSAEAARHTAQTLGFNPELPVGEVNWKDGILEHGIFGTVWEARLPAYAPAARFGIFDGIADATVSLQFEDDGLRTELSWQPLPVVAAKR